MSDLLQEFESFGSIRSSPVDSLGTGIPSLLRQGNPFDEIDESIASVERSKEQLRAQRKGQEFPIFRHQDLSKIRLPTGHITHVQVSNNILTVCLFGNTIFRYDLSPEPSSAEVCEIRREDDAHIHKIFQDPKAQHLLVCMVSKETYYVPREGPKRPQPRLLQKLKGYLIESVGWNMVEQSGQSTGAILFGTNEGSIFEAVIDMQEKRKSYCTEVYELMADMSGHHESVTGLHMQVFPSNGRSGSSNKWFILVTTPSRIYQFIGNTTRGESQFLEMFNYYKDSVKIQFQEIPCILKESKLCVWPQNKLPSSFAWLTGAGVYYGTLVFGDQEPGETLFLEKNLIPYSVVSDTGEEKDGKVELNQKDSALPTGLALTRFHCLLMFRDKIVGICHLNNKKVFEEPFNIRRHGPLTGLCSDPVTGSIWTFAKLNLHMYLPYREARNVWKIYLDQEKFDLAQQFAEGNHANLDLILVRQAEHYFDTERYEDAAVVFSQSQLSFEEVTLKFLQVNKKEALKRFLHLKLDSLGKNEKAQHTMLTTWLMEMYLNELGSLKDSSDTDSYLRLQKEFHDFLRRDSLRDCLYHNSKLIYNLMLSHGSTDDVAFFAKLMKDYEKVVEHHIQQYQYEEALTMLRDRSSEALQERDKTERKAKFQKLADLYYKFSPVLVKHIPRATVDAWISCENYLDPKKLIPSLIQCNQPGDRNQATPEAQNAAAIKYLHFCVHKLRSEETSVHNFLVSSYANSTDPEDHKKLKEYLVQQAQGGLSPKYDVQYALRLCLERGLREPCIYVYSAMGLHAESVSLALKCGDVELARNMISINSLVRKDEPLQKKLWLMIAEHIIKKEKDIEKAMQFLKECNILKIEDILPFFEDVVTIDQFRDAICDSLQSYNTHIDHLKKEMDTATTSAKNIRSDIQEIRNKCVMIKSNRKCSICEGRLLNQSFYMFPCRHSFHRDCLVLEVSSLKTPRERAPLNSLLRELSSVHSPHRPGPSGKEDLQSQLDDLVASDCPFCGLTMIKSIATPLIPLDTLRESLRLWQ